MASNGLPHLSWDLGSIEDIGLGAMHVAEQGFTASWCLGLHVLGSNYLQYVRDPWGRRCGYSSDIDCILRDAGWESRSHTPENTFFLSGPDPPMDFAHDHELGAGKAPPEANQPITKPGKPRPKAG